MSEGKPVSKKAYVILRLHNVDAIPSDSVISSHFLLKNSLPHSLEKEIHPSLLGQKSIWKKPVRKLLLRIGAVQKDAEVRSEEWILCMKKGFSKLM
jgi:hypothetical protein